MKKKMQNHSDSESSESNKEDQKDEPKFEVSINTKKEPITNSDKTYEEVIGQQMSSIYSLPSKSLPDNSASFNFASNVHTQKGFGKQNASSVKSSMSNPPNEQNKEQAFSQNQSNNGFRTNKGFGQSSNPPSFNEQQFQRTNNFNNNNNRQNRPNSFRRDDQNFKYQRNFNNNNESNQQQASYLDEVIKTNIEYIHAIQKAFPNLNERTSAEALQLIQSNSSQTIFEIINDFQTENTIQKTKHLFSQNKSFLPHIDILESIDHKYLNETDSNMIKYYKVYSPENLTINGLPSKYAYTNPNEKRRPLMKNEDGIYNYIPLMCQDGHNENLGNLMCCYAHNDNEVNYHTLTYKTKLCKIKSCDKHNCLNAHSFDELRIIYDYTNKEICNLMQLFVSKGNFKVDNYSMYLAWNKQHIKSFNLSNFKTLKCKTPNCKKDPHLCYYFHSLSEKRRPQTLFKYSNQFCMNIEKGMCPYGDFCHYCHTKYEFFYHPKNFRKIISCTRKKNKNNECPYEDTCYGKHGAEGSHDESIVSFGDRGNVNSKEKEMKNKLETCKTILNAFTCKNCKKVPKDFE